MNKRLLYIFYLNLHPDVGPFRFFSYLGRFSSLEEAYQSSETPQLKDEAERQLEWLERQGIQLISHEDPLYPAGLRLLPDFPSLLFVRGKLDPAFIGVGVVGTRAATPYGLETARSFSRSLSEAGLTVISGLARGIDTAAHQGAVETGKTWGIIASGLAHLYPPENKALAEAIASQGAIITEMPPFTAPNRYLFPRRNRLISALSSALLLVESPIKGGSMLTMEWGKRHNKPLFALPGRVDAPSFEGNHELLKKGEARCLTRPEDIMNYLNIEPNCKNIILNPDLTDDELSFLSKIPSREVPFEELVLLTQLPVMKLNILLSRLILKTAMKELRGNYIRN